MLSTSAFKFNLRRYNVLIATDVAARGLDIPTVRTVISAHPPRSIEDHVHRAGAYTRPLFSST